MAIIERPFCAADQGLIVASYSYDDAQSPPLVTTLTVTNNSEGTQPITAVVVDPLTDQIVFSRTVNAKVGTRSFNIQGQNIRMVDKLSRDGTHYWALPFTIGCQVG